MRISDWSSDVCSSDLKAFGADMGSDLDGTRSYMGDVLGGKYLDQQNPYLESMIDQTNDSVMDRVNALFSKSGQTGSSRQIGELGKQLANNETNLRFQRSEEHTSELQSLMRISYAVFCLQKKKTRKNYNIDIAIHRQ